MIFSSFVTNVPVLVLTFAVAAPALADGARVTGVARPVDGDTFEVGAAVIRLHGIDTPETGQVCERSDGKPWWCDEAALELLASLLGTHVVACDILG